MALVTILEEQGLAFVLQDGEAGAAVEAPKPLIMDETYTVLWDGTKYECVAFGLDGEIVAIGNEIILGVDNGIPFVVMYAPAGTYAEAPFFVLGSIYDTADATHTVGIYQGEDEEPEEPPVPEDPEGIVLKDRNGNDVAYYGIETVTFDTTTEGKQQTFTKGEAVEGLEIEPDFSGGDMAVVAPDGKLVKSATVKKPEALVPENIREGANVGGVVGSAFVPVLETAEVELNFADGDQTVAPSSEDKALSEVTIKKPLALTPENIAEGVTIAGIGPGTHSGGSSGSYIACTLNDAGEIVAARPVGYTTIPTGCFAYMESLKTIDFTGSPGITSIGAHAFRGCTSLTTVQIPESVTSIGQSAFYGCTKLSNITIPNKVTSIGTYIFYQCEALTSIVIPNNITSIGKYSFCKCTALTSITIPNSVTSIGDYAFDGSALESIAIPNSVTSIGNYAFRNCSALSNVTIGSGVKTIGNYAFNQCKLLTSITIPNNVTSIGTNMLQSCTALTSVSIGSGVTIVNTSLLQGCTSLTNVTIGSNVTSIENQAFYQCTALVSITIPAKVTNIGYAAFALCSALTSATFADSTTWYTGGSKGATTNKVNYITDKSYAATYLWSTFTYYYWTKV